MRRAAALEWASCRSAWSESSAAALSNSASCGSGWRSGVNDWGYSSVLAYSVQSAQESRAQRFGRASANATSHASMAYSMMCASLLTYQLLVGVCDRLDQK